MEREDKMLAMKMNIRQQYLLTLLGLDKKGKLSDFEAFAVKNRLDFGKSKSVAAMLSWYGKETKDARLQKVTPEKVKETAEGVVAAFERLDLFECSCVSPCTPGYPEGMLSLLDAKNHVINSPYLFCKGDTRLLPRIRLSLYGTDLYGDDDSRFLEQVARDLKEMDALPLVPMTATSSERIVIQLMKEGIVPVLLVPAGIDHYMTDMDNEWTGTLCEVLEADGLAVSVFPPGVTPGRNCPIKTLLHLAGFARNILVFRLPSSGREDTVMESARTNALNVLVPPFGLPPTGSGQDAVAKREGIVYLKQGMKLCGALR